MKNLILIITILIFQFSYAQLDPNGVLILNSGTTAEINAISPEAGALVFNTDTNKTYVYNGTTWVIASGTNENWTTSGNNQYSAVSGNVGIGNPTPDTKLDIKDDSIDFDNVNATAGSGNAWNQHGLKITGSNNSMNFIVSNQFNDRRAIIQAGHENIGYAQYLSTLALNPFGGNVGVGTKSPSAKLEVAGQVKITGGTPGNGKILTSDATGLATWQDASSVTNNSILIDGENQTMFGSSPGSSTGNCIVSHGIATFFTNTGDNNYIHIKLPYRIDTHNEMYHIKATGYRYGASKVIDITWVGYCYKNGNALLSTSNTNSGDSEFNITQYVGSDKHIYLRFRGTTGSNYYQSFRVDSMNVGNGSVLTEGDIQIISSASANL